MTNRVKGWKSHNTVKEKENDSLFMGYFFNFTMAANFSILTK